MRPRFLLFIVALFAFVQTVQAQIQVGLEIKRRFLMVYEPIVATVTITNLAGRDLTLADSPTQSWFGFQVNYGDGNRIIPPMDPDYRQDPMIIRMGESLKRSVVLNSLFPMGDLGLYRIRATIYDSGREKYFQSPVVGVELSEGKVIWQQNVGVPTGQNGAGSMRRVSLLTFRRAESNYLYARVEEPDAAIIHGTVALGRIITGIDPEAEFDRQNVLHVLHVIGNKQYLHTCVNLDGQVIAQDSYLIGKFRPILKRDATGNITVFGASIMGPPGQKVPNKLSDRPVVIPKD